jgi:acetyltransferase-like isoleucine patch superfamily enzyme
MRSLNRLRWLQQALQKAQRMVFTRFWGMTIHETARISLKAHLDITHPAGVHIGAYSYVAFGATILTHDMTRRKRAKTTVGRNCFIGARSILMPGVTVGDGSIVAAGAVVTKDVPPACAVAGNPAVVVREGIETTEYGVLFDETKYGRRVSDGR